jgi:hypothetical protein
MSDNETITELNKEVKIPPYKQPGFNLEQGIKDIVQAIEIAEKWIKYFENDENSPNENK